MVTRAHSDVPADSGCCRIDLLSHARTHGLLSVTVKGSGALESNTGRVGFCEPFADVLMLAWFSIFNIYELKRSNMVNGIAQVDANIMCVKPIDNVHYIMAQRIERYVIWSKINFVDLKF